MKNNILKILNLKHFFKIVQSTENNVQYQFKNPSILLINNIHIQWLKSISAKTGKSLPVFINKNDTDNDKPKLPFGIIYTEIPELSSELLVEHNLVNYAPDVQSTLKFQLSMAKQDAMQQFITWQRYRKYWWSSITTTPGLFNINDIRYKDESAHTDVIVQLPWGNLVVEKVAMDLGNNQSESAVLQCQTNLETALLTVLADGLLNSNAEHYLRLQRSVAPYKISFALEWKDQEKYSTLQDLAFLINTKLNKKNISTWYPDFQLSIEEQLKVNWQLGVVYTAIISEDTLVDGIFHLMNSSTMLKEQVHLADFDSYAALLCGV